MATKNFPDCTLNHPQFLSLDQAWVAKLIPSPPGSPIPLHFIRTILYTSMRNLKQRGGEEHGDKAK